MSKSNDAMKNPFNLVLRQFWGKDFAAEVDRMVSPGRLTLRNG